MFHQDGLFKAIRHFGSQQALAKAINASQQQVNYWLNSGKNISYEYVLKIEAATNGAVNRHELAPCNQEVNTIIDKLIEQGVKKAINRVFDELQFELSILLNIKKATENNSSFFTFNYIETLTNNLGKNKFKNSPKHNESEQDQNIINKK